MRLTSFTASRTSPRYAIAVAHAVAQPGTLVGPKCAVQFSCVEVWQTSNLRRLRLGQENKDKKKKKKKKSKDENIMVCPIP